MAAMNAVMRRRVRFINELGSLDDGQTVIPTTDNPQGFVARALRAKCAKGKDWAFRGLCAQACQSGRSLLTSGEANSTSGVRHTERDTMMNRLPLMIGTLGAGLLIGMLPPAVAVASPHSPAPGPHVGSPAHPRPFSPNPTGPAPTPDDPKSQQIQQQLQQVQQTEQQLQQLQQQLNQTRGR